MKLYTFILCLLICSIANAQELFVFTEPASNMPARSIAVRAANSFMYNESEKKYNYHLLPSVMWGVSRKLMLHGSLFMSTRNQSFLFEGGSFYAKWRFFSRDDIHSHFRMAAYGKFSSNNSDVHQAAVDFMGHNSGYEGGLVATKLKNKLAISGNVSFLRAMDNGRQKFHYSDDQRNAISYSLSIGKLIHPKEYSSYQQTNINLMCEILGQSNLGNHLHYIDVAPSIQFIFNSNLRVDFGYRAPLVNDLRRSTSTGWMIGGEYNFYNVYKKKKNKN